jgi:mRNA interferase YafQ
MLEIVYTGKMKSDVKRMKKRGRDISKLITMLELLATGNLCRQTTVTTS